MSIGVGERLPAGAFKCLDGDRQRWITTQELFDGRRVIVVSIRGAFVPSGAEQRLPGYLRAAEEFERLGVDEIVCTAVNDPWVLDAWRKHIGAGERIRMLADAHGEYHHALGLQRDCSAQLLGWRSAGFSMLVEDGVVRSLDMEREDGAGAGDAPTMLARLAELAPTRAPEGEVRAALSAPLGVREWRSVRTLEAWAESYRLPGGSATRLVDEVYAEAPEVVSVLTGTFVARSGVAKEAWRQAELAMETHYLSRRVVFDSVQASGDCLAVEARIEQVLKDGSRRGWPFAVFMRVDERGRIVSDHTYMLPPPHQEIFDDAAAGTERERRRPT